ncbi:hypothetical protein L195_g052286 [Trifolium pratense]|uniref:Uncharacterized protein n=1 Tax=Trifolium pratense TaxID=57577 RepID=A0A2K3K4C2_TRIPR|nr:hypothetical protein L195_g052286 [Trifolium pratense]
MSNLAYVWVSVSSPPPDSEMPFHRDFRKLQSVASPTKWFSAASFGVADAQPNTCLTYEYDN